MSDPQNPKPSALVPVVLPSPNQSLSEPSSPPSESDPPADPEAWLSAREQHALAHFRRTQGTRGSLTYPLAESVAEGLFALYINGRSIEEIRRLNPTYSEGQIVHAAVTYNWHARAQGQVQLMEARAKYRALVAQSQALDHVADLMAAIRQKHGDNVARYLQTGDLNALGGADSTTSIRQLKDLVDLITKLTGQDGKRAVSGKIVHEHVGLPTIPAQQVPTSPAQLMQWAQEAREAQAKKNSR